MCRLPISVLEHNIVAEFENLAMTSRVDIKRAIGSKQVNPEIDLLLDKIPPRGPYADLDSKRVVLYESHLAFIWAYIYSNFVIYEECVQKPMVAGTFDGEIHYLDQLTIRAKLIQDWALTFSKRYIPWDCSVLPNPKTQVNAEEKIYCEKTNGIYLKAVSFLLLHEYAHLTLGHRVGSDDKIWSIEQEKDADNFALSCLVDDSSTEIERQIAGLAIVLLYASNFLLPKDVRGIWQSSHPHLHDRLRNGVVGLNLQSEKSKFYLYYLASIAIQGYLQSKDVELKGFECETAEDLFYEYLEKIDELRVN